MGAALPTSRPAHQKSAVRFSDLPPAARLALSKELSRMKESCVEIDRVTPSLIRPNGKKPTLEQVRSALETAVPLYKLVREQVPTDKLVAGDDRDPSMSILTRIVNSTVSFVMAASFTFGDAIQPYYDQIAGITTGNGTK